MPVWFHRPAAWDGDGRVVVVMHGLNRDAGRYRDEWAALAEAGGFLVLVPEFSASKFPGTRWYNFGNLVDDEGRATAPQSWSFHAFDRVVAAAMAAAHATRPGFILYGHSAGAQFVHRYLLLTGAKRAESIVIANAGSYTLALDRPFPEGLRGTAVDPAALRAAFARPVVLQLGIISVGNRTLSCVICVGGIKKSPHKFKVVVLFIVVINKRVNGIAV